MNDAGRERTAGHDGPAAPGDDYGDSYEDSLRPGRRRRGPLFVAGGFLLVTVVGVVGALGLGGGGSDDAGAPGRSSRVVRVTRDTLTDQTEVDGELGHGPEVPFPVKAEGTVTWLPATGRTVRRGEAVLRVDDRPVVLLYGSLPMYRELGITRESPQPRDANPAEESASSSAKGEADTESAPPQPTRRAAAPRPLHGMDVKQFEANLSALGYSGFTVDETYTELTANAVKRWQKDLGLPQTGRVGIGDVVYAPGAVRVAGTSARIGDSPGGSPVSYTSTSRMVTVNARADDTNWAQRGNKVTVDLPDGHSIKGTVASLGTDASAAEGGGGGTEGGDAGSNAGSGDGGTGPGSGGKSATVSVVIVFADRDALGRLQSGPVGVRYVTRQRKDVLTVPVAALTALAEGGYGLELAPAEHRGGDGADGSGTYVPVKTGLFADGKVEVSGPRVHEGMKVRIPK
ncbi:peptidoglycan-binding domain-containing protein [Streptomyces sp. NPDC046805]|uniref:peptidoglycan-binding domain-containing protein n=1 Tax=Streptomyces sp. NPDC046805 TaxID=3155134 RepID=UPI0033C8FE9F